MSVLPYRPATVVRFAMFVVLACVLAGCGEDASGPTTIDTPALACRSDAELGEKQLDSRFCVVGQWTISEIATATALALDDEALYVYQPLASEESVPTIFAVERRPLDLAGQTIGDADELFRFEPDGEGPVFAGQYLARSTGGATAVGYTRGDFSGAVLHTASGQPQPDELGAPGNFDAVWWDDETLLAHGTGLGAASGAVAVYAWRRGTDPFALIAELGSASSYLALGTDVLYVGEAAWPDNKVYAFSRQEVEAALEQRTTLKTSAGDLVYEGPAADITALHDDLVVLDVTYDDEANAVFNGVRRIGTTVAQDAVSAEETSDVLTPAAPAAAGPSQLITYGGWLAFVEDAAEGKRVTIIRLE